MRSVAALPVSLSRRWPRGGFKTHRVGGRGRCCQTCRRAFRACRAVSSGTDPAAAGRPLLHEPADNCSAESMVSGRVSVELHLATSYGSVDVVGHSPGGVLALAAAVRVPGGNSLGWC